MGLIDLTGQRFNKLTVIERDKTKKGGAAYWKCKCDCGNIKSIRGTRLRNGEVVDCGCGFEERAHKERDTTSLLNKRFGRLVVIERDLERPTGRGYPSYWKCQCDCGKITSVEYGSLVHGKTKSCGCLRSELIREKNTLDLTNQRFGKLTAIRNTYETTMHNSYIWECQCDCGNIHYVSAEILRSGKINSCGCIASSFGEEKIEKILLDADICYNKEYTFSDLKSDKNRYFRYDFAILNSENYPIRLIEFDGEQHFNKNSKFYSERIAEADKIKNDYAKKHNIPLVRIPYTQLKNISLDMILGDEYTI